MLDISLAAIESELGIAYATAGTKQSDQALARAQIIATLYAAQPAEQTFDVVPPRVPGATTYSVKHDASLEDRIEAASWMLQMDKADLQHRLFPDERDPVDPDDDDGDFFAEARKDKKK